MSAIRGRRVIGHAVWTAIALATPALAHEVSAPSGAAGPRSLAELWRSWPFEPWISLPLLVLVLLYARGAAPRPDGVRPVRPWEVTAFATGWLALAIALVSPLHPLGQMLFAAHMAQHELLMLVAAPLLVLGRPHVAVLRALPLGLVRRVARSAPVTALREPIHVASHPAGAWLLHAIVLWTWHAPALFQAALRSEWVHAAQHASFLGSAVWFWWSVLERGARRVSGYGAAVLFLFTTAVHSGFLGMLLTFATAPWYADYVGRTTAWGLTPLEDQQLGGAIMWAPACLFYAIAGLALFLAWLRAGDTGALRGSSATSPPA